MTALITFTERLGVRPRRILAGFVSLVSIAYVVERIAAFRTQSSIDFRHTWVAAQMWTSGDNPYSPDFAELGAQSFASGDLPRIWVYPPNWYPITAPFAPLGDVAGSIIWNLISAVLMIVACWLLAGVAVPLLGSMPRWSRSMLHSGDPFTDRFVFFAVAFGFVTFLQGTAISLTTGQSGLIALFGVALLLWSLVHDRRGWGVVAIVILMLKPQVGAIFCFVLLFDRENWLMIGKAAVATVLAAIPPFLFSTPSEILDGMFENWDELYSVAYEPNLPEQVSGVRNLLHWAGLGDVGVQLGVVLAVATVLVGGWLVQRAPQNFLPGEREVLRISVAIASVIGFVTIQSYDMPVLGVLLVVAFACAGLRLAALTFAVALLYRSANVETIVGSSTLTSGRLETVASLIIFAVVASIVLTVARKPVPNS